MKRVTIKIDRKISDDDVQMLKTSLRKYSSIKIYNQQDRKEVEIIKSRRWSELNLTHVKFDTPKEYYEYLQPLAKNLKSLTLCWIDIQDETKPADKKLGFPRVEMSKFHACSALALQTLDTKFPRLRNICVWPRRDSGKYTVEVMNQNSDLNSFSLFEYFNDDFIKKYLPLVAPMKIKTLNFVHRYTSLESKRNGRVFLASIGTSLQKLFLHSIADATEIIDIWEHLPNLKQFKIVTYAKIYVDEIISLKPNENLKEMSISWKFQKPNPVAYPIQWCKTLLLGVPKLEKLSICVLNQEIFSYFEENLKHL